MKLASWNNWPTSSYYIARFNPHCACIEHTVKLTKFTAATFNKQLLWIYGTHLDIPIQ